MKLWKATSVAFLCLPAFLAGQLNPPHPGCVRYADGFIANVFGLPGNFIVRASGMPPADVASFSDVGGLLAREGHIVLVKADGSIAGQFAANATAPLLSITGDLVTALAWLPDQHTILSWTGTNFKSTEIADPLPPGSVTSIISAGNSRASVLVTQPGGAVSRCLISIVNGSVPSCDVLPGVTGPAFEQAGFVVFKDDRGLEIQDQAGNVRTLSLSTSNLQFQRMSSNWVHIYSADAQQHWALHLTRADCNLSLLPAAHPVQGAAE